MIAKTAMDDRVEQVADAVEKCLSPPNGRAFCKYIVQAAIEADDSTLAEENERLRNELVSWQNTANNHREHLMRLNQMISHMENEDPELVERWRAFIEDKPHNK